MLDEVEIVRSSTTETLQGSRAKSRPATFALHQLNRQRSPGSPTCSHLIFIVWVGIGQRVLDGDMVTEKIKNRVVGAASTSSAD